MGDAILEVKHLKKTFKNITAVKDLSFEVKRGSFFAFLGENGAGKSTTIKMIAGILPPDSGVILRDGKDISRFSEKERIEEQKKFGLVFQNSVLDSPLSVKENLLTRARLYGMKKEDAERRIEELANELSFTSLLKRPLKPFSGGERRRIDIARALLLKPKLLILDEPTTGLDPETRKALWGELERLRKEENLTLFLTTHYMEEAEDADDVIILEKGEIAAKGSAEELRKKYTKTYLHLYGVKKKELTLPNPIEKTSSGVMITCRDSEEAYSLLSMHPEWLSRFEVKEGGMDEVFLQVIQNKERTE